MEYPCKSRPDLQDWSVVYKVSPLGYIPSSESDNPSQGSTHDVLFYQEDGLEGEFVIDLGGCLESLTSFVSDEITDPKELEVLEKLRVGGQQDEGEEESDEEEFATPCYDENDF